MKNVISDWLSSPNTPLVAIPSQRIGEWTGIGSNEHGTGVYDRAADLPGYTGVLDVGAFQVLVLGDEPLPTATIDSLGGISIVRCVYCENLKTLDRLLAGVPYELGTPVWESVLRVGTYRDWVLFDALHAGLGDVVRLPFRLSAGGTYRILTYEVQLNHQNRVLVHRFVVSQ